ncbi:MAG: TonB-dependent receptor protein [Verrucomicrobiaceae bacterium]|nr:TonB-dependent receptor protein [Verrucomicrobiaceae bacterium]
MTVITSSLIENTVAGDMDQIYKINPLTQNSAPSTVYDTPYAVIRGFHTQQGIVDGVRLSSALYGISMEEMERVEIINGLSGFLYGAGNVGGTTNFVLKRPTEKRVTNVTLGNYGGDQYFAHVDLGGPIDSDGKFGYRFNAAYQDGDTEKDNQHLKKSLISGAFDWHVTDDFLLQLEAGHRDYQLDGADSRFYFTGIKRPSSYDNDKTHTPTWSYNDVKTDRYGVNGQWTINEHLTARAAYLYKQDDRESIYTYPLLQSNNTFNVGVSNVAPNQMTAQGAYGYLDTNFHTFGIQHTLTVGISGDKYEVRQHGDSSSYVVFSGYDLRGIASLQQPVTPPIGTKPLYTASKAENRNIVVGDDISFGEHWSALIGFNRSTLENKSINASGVTTADYDKSDITPTLSIIYKPVENLSVYASYMEAMEQGTIVGSTYKNRDEVLDPMISKQYEIGAKGSLGNVALTSALFCIEKANQYSDDGTPTGTYVQDGLQVHEGIELTATGKLSDNLTIVAGGVWMDLTIKKSNNPALEGKMPSGVADKMAKLYAEYSVPGVNGLTLSGGAFYTGSYYGDGLNTDDIKDFVVGDIGARYATKIYNTPATVRLNVTNIANVDYWATNYSLGIPRTVALSIGMSF